MFFAFFSHLIFKAVNLRPMGMTHSHSFGWLILFHLPQIYLDNVKFFSKILGLTINDNHKAKQRKNRCLKIKKLY